MGKGNPVGLFKKWREIPQTAEERAGQWTRRELLEHWGTIPEGMKLSALSMAPRTSSACSAGICGTRSTGSLPSRRRGNEGNGPTCIGSCRTVESSRQSSLRTGQLPSVRCMAGE
jgi:hypothetical protein